VWDSHESRRESQSLEKASTLTEILPLEIDRSIGSNKKRKIHKKERSGVE